jgi:hypothetical protein
VITGEDVAGALPGARDDEFAHKLAPSPFKLLVLRNIKGNGSDSSVVGALILTPSTRSVFSPLLYNAEECAQSPINRKRSVNRE